MLAEHADVMDQLDGWKCKWTDELRDQVQAAGEKFKGQFV
jgi:hypothetical protein